MKTATLDTPVKKEDKAIVATNKILSPISKALLRDLAPAAFQSEAHSKMSKYYQYVNTAEVIDKLMKAGFKPFRANQLRYRDEKNPNNGYQFHKVTFYHPDYVVVNSKNQIEEMFEISVANSHNGSSKFSLHGSFYRLACDNGMLCISNDLGHLVTRHMGETNVNIKELLETLEAQFGDMMKNVKKMKSKLLSTEKKAQLAAELLKVRGSKNQKFNFDPKELLTPLRTEDKGNSLWSVYNVLQEKLIKGYDFAGGSVAGAEDKKAARKLRAVNNFQSQMELNKAFWEIAKQFN